MSDRRQDVGCVVIDHPMHDDELSRGWHHVSMALLHEIQSAATAHKIEVAASALFHARLVFERTARSLDAALQANGARHANERIDDE